MLKNKKHLTKIEKDFGVKLVFYRTLYSQSAASLTMGSIAACLRKEGVDVELCLLKRNLFQRNELNSGKELLKDYEKYKVAIVKPNFKDYMEIFPLLERCKAEGIFKRAFLCGPFASLNAVNLIKRNSWVDGIILNYPEETVVDLVKSLSNDLLSWNYNCKGGIWRNPKTKQLHINKARQMSNLDNLPFPARDVEKKEKVAYINLEASRGCNFCCSYCHVPLYHGFCQVKKRITKSPKKVVDEIEKINHTLGKTFFIFNDSNFWVGKEDDKRINAICDEIIKRRLNISFYIYLRCNPFPSEKLIKKLSEAGLVRVFLGVENKSKLSLKLYNKKINLNNFEKAKKILIKYNINIHIGYIVFNPYSTLEDIEINIEYLNKINKLFRIGVVLEQIRVIPNTKIHNKLINDGLISKSLNYDEITYGYKYLNKNVANLYEGIKLMFVSNLNCLGYDVEYYCVSGQLLQSLTMKLNPKNNLQEKFDDFNSVCLKAKKIMYIYLMKAISMAREGCKPSQIGSMKKHKGFVKDYKNVAYELQAAWGNIIEYVKKIDKNIDKQIFEGVE